ncbi:MAG: NlpC/P60 family protein [Chthoniobacterales bacterium]
MALTSCFLATLATSLRAQESALESSFQAAVESAHGLSYNAVWMPPNELAPLRMDCSNTAQWLKRSCQRIYLPRTASAQYLLCQQTRRLFSASHNPETLRQRLQTGDLLFWKNTYHPERKPPITHVMIYLGRDSQGQMWMAGSQTSHGVAIYHFHPDKPMGGYRFFFGLFKCKGQFIAYGRPSDSPTSSIQ